MCRSELLSSLLFQVRQVNSAAERGGEDSCEEVSSCPIVITLPNL